MRVRGVLSLVAALAAAQPVVAGRPGPDEPSWQRRPLSDWTRALSASDPAERIRAADAIAQIAISHGGEAAGPAVPALRSTLEAQRPELRRSAAAALEQIGPPAVAAVPRLITLLAEDDQPSVRQSAALALARIAPDASAVVDAAAGRLTTEPDPAARASAAALLVFSGSAATRVSGPLSDALHDRSDSVRLYAAAALAHADADRAVPILLRAVTADDPGLRAEAVGLLPDAARGRSELLPALTSALRDPAPEVRISAAQAIGSLGRDAASMVPTLWALIHDPSDSVREEALVAIKRIKTNEMKNGK